jgi:alkylation response protein AidB-like acyl-CoA dehydrogenase
MDFTEEQIAFRDSVRRMAEKHVAPIAAEIDETDRFPTELVKLYGEMGLMQLWIPERYGGPEGNLTMMCIAREEISRFSPACGSIAGLNTMFIMPLLHFGTEEQRQRFLPPVAKGGVVTAIAISEPQAGSDVSAMTTRAVRDGDSYVINGRKQWCSYGVEADYIVVMARTSGRPRRRRHQRLRRRAEDDEGRELRPPRAQDGLARCAQHADLPGQRARAGREPDRRGRQGLSRQHARAGPEPPDHRRAVRGPGAGRAGRQVAYAKERKQFRQPSPTSRACSSCWPTW